MLSGLPRWAMLRQRQRHRAVRAAMETLESRVVLSAGWFPDLQGYTVPADNPPLPAGMNHFAPPVDGQTPAAGAPQIGQWTRTGEAGDVIPLTGWQLSAFSGIDFGRDTRFFTYSQTSPLDGRLIDASILRLDTDNIQAAIRLGDDLGDYSMYLLWAQNGQGTSYPVAINRTEAWWCGDAATRGQTVSVFGRNLSHFGANYQGTHSSWVYLQPSVGSGTWATVTAANPYKVDFLVPQGLANGVYEVWVHNGHGGRYGWSRSPVNLTISDPVTWTGTVRNVRHYGATGDGVTDDTAFIQAAIAAMQPGDQLYFPAGTYQCYASTFTIPAHARVYGDGRDATLWKSAKATFGGNTKIEQLSFENQQGIAPAGAYVWIDAVRVHQTGGYSYYTMNLSGANHAYITNSEFIGNKTINVPSQTFYDNCTFKARFDAEACLEAWGNKQLSVTNCTFQHYDMSNPGSSSGWGEGRAWVGYAHWGNHQQQYFGNNRTVDFVVRSGGDQNSGEMLLWEGSYPFYNGSITAATSNTITFDPGADVPTTAMRIVVTGGKGMGQVRSVASYSAGTFTTTLTEPWNVIPDPASSTILLVRTFDKVAVYRNYFDGTQTAVDQTAHVANAGVDTFYGGIDFIVDSNTFHEMRTGVVWNPAGGTDKSAVNYSQYVANNTFDYVRWAASVSGSTNLVGEAQLLNVFRDNLVTGNVADVAFKTGKATLNVYDSNHVTDAKSGFAFSSSASDNLILYGNELAQGEGEFAGSVGIQFGAAGAGSLFMHGNTWSGFQTGTTGTPPAATVELPRRVVAVDVAPGASTQVTVPLWNSGLSNLAWSVSDDAPWLSVAPGSGSLADQSGQQTLTLTCNAASLSSGSYTGTVTVTGAGQTMKLTLDLTVGVRPTVAGYAGPAVLAAGSQITLTGTGFVPGTAVRIGGTTLATVAYDSSTQLTVTLPAMPAADGIYSLEVINPDGLTARLDEGIAYGRYLDWCTPDNDGLAGGRTITIHGAGFEPGMSFFVNGAPATNVVVLSPRQATFTAPSGGSTVGLATITALSGPNAFTGTPKFGYHATYISPWYGDAGVTALRAKAADPFYANYVQPILARAQKHLTTGLKNSFDSNSSVIESELYGYLLTGKQEYRDRLMREVDYVANTIGWVSANGQVAVGRVAAMASAYNALGAELTAAERGWFEGYFTALLNDNPNTWGWWQNPGSNTVAVAAGTAGLAGLVMKHTLYGPAAYAIEWSINLLNSSYIGSGVMPDGGNPESSLYWDFGFGYYLYFAKALEQATGSHQGLLAPSVLLSMRNYVEFLLAGDKVTGMQTFGDTQPFLTGFSISAELGTRLDDGLYRWLADEMARRVAEDADGLVNSYYRNNLDVRDPFVAMGFLWRDAVPAPASFPTIATKVVLTNNTQGATIRTDGSDFYPDMVVSAIGGHAYGHHKQYDKGSFVVQANEEAYLIDPGYYQGYSSDGDQTVHSIPLIDGKGVSDSNLPMATITASFEDSAAGYRGFVMDTTAAYVNSAAVRATRTFVMTQQGLEGEALILLDDIVASGTGIVTAQYQAGFAAQSIDGGRGAVINGNNGRLLLRTFGPTASLSVSGPKDFESSWYFDRLGVQWYQVRGNYTANADMPLVTVMLPLNNLTDARPVAGMDFDVTYGAGTIAVSLPGGATVNFAQVGGAWEFAGYVQPPTPKVSLITVDGNASEAGQDPGRFMVYRSGSTAGDLTVNYTIGGTADPGDYSPLLTGSVVIPAGQRYAYIDIIPVDDALPEITEFLTLTLQDGAAYDLAYPAVGTIAIADNDVRTLRWIGGTGSWSNPMNWDLGQVPGPNDVAVFSSGTSVTLDTQDQTVGWVTIDSLSSFSILGTYKLILNGGQLNVNAQAGKMHTITAPIGGTATAVNFFGSGTHSFGNAANDFVAPISIAGGTFNYNTVGSDAIFGNAGNDITLSGGVRINIGTNGGNFDPAAGRIVTIGEGGATFYAHGDDVLFNDADQLRGSGRITFVTGNYGATMTLSAAQPNFSGGFDVAHTYGQRRPTNLVASAAGALGTGPVTVSGIGGMVTYTWGAQTPVGGVVAGITASDHGTINLSGTWTNTRDRFTVNAFGQIRGSSTLLGYVRRVGSFSGAQTQPEVILATDAVVTHTTVSTASIQNLGTAHDLIFGLGTNFNTAGFVLNIGNNSPWKGIGRETSALNSTTSENTRRLQKGTLNIDGSGGFDEMVFLAVGMSYTLEERLLIGSGADCPAFVLTGGSKVTARVLDGQGMGRFVLDSSAPNYANAISQWIVGDSTQTAEMIVTYANGLGGVPIIVESGGKLTASTPTSLNADVTVNTGGTVIGPITVGAGRRLSGGGTVTGVITIESGGILAPGSPHGTMSLPSGLTLAEGAIYEYGIGATASDSVAVGGLLTLPAGGSTWTLKLINAGGFITRDHTIFTHSGVAPNLSGAVIDYGTTGWSGTWLENRLSSVVMTGMWPVVTLSATDTSAHEQGQDPGRFTISRSDSAGDLTVHYTISGTASGADYNPTLTGSLVIPDGQTSVVLTITPVDDDVVEGAETLTLGLLGSDTYGQGASISGTVTIGDNDGPPTITLWASDTTAAEAGLSTGAFTVSRSFIGPAMTVYYSLAGTATNGLDYSYLGGWVVIPAGQSTATILVTPLDDALIEPAETVTLQLLADAAYQVGSPAGGTVTIASDDKPVVSVTAIDATASEAGGDSAVLRISRSGPGDINSAELAVMYELSGNASAADYSQTLSGVAVIPAGQSYVDIVVTPVDDAIVEGHEQLKLTLTTTPVYGLGAPNSATILILDDDFVPSTVTWTNAGGDGLASNPANWSGPLGHGASILLDGTSNADLVWNVNYNVSNWTQTSAYTGTVTIATTYATFSQAFTTFYISGDVTLQGGKWTHTAQTLGYSDSGRDQYRLSAMVYGNFTLAATASIDVTSKGYVPGKPTYNGGGSHGGRSSYPTTPYDDPFNPLYHGTGGGSATGNNYAGGGTVRLLVGGAATIDGAIRANVTAPGGTSSRAAAGGSVYLEAAGLAGSGTIEAAGGDSLGGSNTNAGGGGRVAVILTHPASTFSTFTGTISARPGTGGAFTGKPAAGSVYLQAGNQGPKQGTLLIDSANRGGDTIDDAGYQFLAEDMSKSRVVLRNKGLLRLTANAIIGGLDMAAGTNILLDGRTLTINSSPQEAVLGGTIYLDTAKTQVYNPLVGSPQVIFTRVTEPTIRGTSGEDAYYVRQINDGQSLLIWAGTAPVGDPTWTYLAADLAKVTFDLLGGSDTLSVEAGVTVPIVFAGGAGDDNLIIGGGTVALAGDEDLGSLTIGGDGRLDVGTFSLVVRNGDIGQISTWLASGMNGGSTPWTGPGINSSVAAADPAGRYAVGVGPAAEAADVLIRYTRYGDANLDGTVNFNDLLRLSQNYNTTGRNWSQGDFNHDGNVNFNDLLKLSQNYNQGISSPPAEAPSPVLTADADSPASADDGAAAMIDDSLLVIEPRRKAEWSSLSGEILGVEPARTA